MRRVISRTASALSAATNRFIGVVHASVVIVLELVGFGAITAGVWLIYPPAGVITAGLLAVTLAVLIDSATTVIRVNE